MAVCSAIGVGTALLIAAAMGGPTTSLAHLHAWEMPGHREIPTAKPAVSMDVSGVDPGVSAVAELERVGDMADLAMLTWRRIELRRDLRSTKPGLDGAAELIEQARHRQAQSLVAQLSAQLAQATEAYRMLRIRLIDPAVPLDLN